MNRVIVFDVNETLLDLAALDPLFASIFGDARVRREWFAQVLLCAMTTSLTGAYADFGAVAAAALDLTAARHRIGLSRQQRQRILAGMRALPPHPEVPGALARLREAGLRLACLTNSAPETAHAQIQGAGLASYFEAILSVDDVRRYKPAPEPYRMAAYRLGVDIAQLRLVAAHDWDVTGAIRAGCSAAYVARDGTAPGPVGEIPDITGPDLDRVAEQILEQDRPEHVRQA